MKAVAGGSYRFPLGHGLLTFVEYHYSGYGATSPAAILALLQDPAFRERYLRGDTQILGRHAVAALTSYEVSPEISLAGQWLHDPVTRCHPDRHRLPARTRESVRRQGRRLRSDA